MGNATRSKTWLRKFVLSRTIHGGPPLLDHFPVAASQAIEAGDPVTVSGGEISLAAANSGAIFGVAAGNVTTTAADEKTKCPVFLADRSNIFIGQADAASSGIADGAECDIIVASTDWKLDIGATTEGVAQIVKHVEGDSISDATDFGRLEFIWKRSSYDNLVAAK